MDDPRPSSSTETGRSSRPSVPDSSWESSSRSPTSSAIASTMTRLRPMNSRSTPASSTLPVEDEVEIAVEAGQRRAQLVGDRGHEVGPLGVPCPEHRELAFVRELLGRSDEDECRVAGHRRRQALGQRGRRRRVREVEPEDRAPGPGSAIALRADDVRLGRVRRARPVDLVARPWLAREMAAAGEAARSDRERGAVASSQAARAWAADPSSVSMMETATRRSMPSAGPRLAARRLRGRAARGCRQGGPRRTGRRRARRARRPAGASPGGRCGPRRGAT